MQTVPHKTCKEKIAYPSAQKASQHLAKIKRATNYRQDDQKTPRSFYKCPECQQYHLTSYLRSLDPDLKKEFPRDTTNTNTN